MISDGIVAAAALTGCPEVSDIQILDTGLTGHRTANATILMAL